MSDGEKGVVGEPLPIQMTSATNHLELMNKKWVDYRPLAGEG